MRLSYFPLSRQDFISSELTALLRKFARTPAFPLSFLTSPFKRSYPASLIRRSCASQNLPFSFAQYRALVPISPLPCPLVYSQTKAALPASTIFFISGTGGTYDPPS